MVIVIMENVIWKIIIKKTNIFDIAERLNGKNKEKVHILSINSDDEVLCEILDVGSAKNA